MTPPHPVPGRSRPTRAELQRLPVRRLTLADLPACSDLADSRGWSREEHKWRLLLTAGQGYGVDAPGRDGALIGAFVLTRYAALPPALPREGADGGPAEAAAGWTAISMVLVAEHCARQGLGRRMMRHALDECGATVPFLTATENGRPLYEELGFTSVGRLTMLTGRFADDDARRPGHTPADLADSEGRAPHVRPATAADMQAVRALDAPAFGADRTGLLARLPAFADRFVVAEAADGSLTGFAASWPNTRNTVVGPVVAEDPRSARALVRDLGRHAPGEIRVDVDSRHRELEEWLRARGLSGDFGCTLMVRTASDLPGDPARRVAPYSVALG